MLKRAHDSHFEGKKPKNNVLWLKMLLAITLYIVVLLVMRVPQNIEMGNNGQLALNELDGLCQFLLHIKVAASRYYIDEDADKTQKQLNALAKQVQSKVQHYAKVARYNSALSQQAVYFIPFYKTWLDHENDYLTQYSQLHKSAETHLDEHNLNLKASENSILFLSVMQSLADGEPLLHEDITRGHEAILLLQWASILLVIYFFSLILFFKRDSDRIHAMRNANLGVTLRSIGDAVIATDIQGNVTCMSPEAERMTGWDFAEAEGRALTEVFRVVNEHSGEPVDDMVELVQRKNSIVVNAEDSMLIASDGSRYQIYENGAPIYGDSGVIVGVLLVFRDITQSHQLKTQLSDNAQRLRRIVDTSMDAVIVIDELGNVKEWNPAAESIFGWTNDEIRQRPIHESIIPKEFRQQHLNGIKRLVSSNRSTVLAKRIESLALHRDGHIFPIELAMTSIRTEKGWKFNAFIRDLSDHRHKEYVIDKKSRLLNEAMSIAKLGYWELDLQQGELEWSDEIFKMFNLDPHSTKPSYGLFLNAVHPEDRASVDSAYTESLTSKTPYNIIHRIVTTDGIKIVNEQCETSYDDTGKPLRSIGLVQDITEQMNNLDELRFASTTFLAHAGILITDKNGKIVRVNPAVEKMTGYTAKELLGSNPSILKSGKQSKKFYRDMWARISSTGMWQGELWNRRKDGTLYAEWLTITAVKDNTGEVTHYVATSQDITTRKQAELKVEYLAYHDDLTTLANRKLLHERLQYTIAACRRHKEFGAVLLLDLDRFKDLNDSLGYSVGDEILCQVASRLKELVRDEDTVARLGGDKFVVVLSSVSDDISKIGFKVREMAEKIRICLTQPYEYSGGHCQSNVSIGISLFPEKFEDIDDILKHADTALHRAKEHGRNTVCFYQPGMQFEVEARLAIGDGLRRAIKNNEFVLHYQPQLNHSGDLCGAEALIRWQHPEKGMVPPDEFISVAEDMGLILDIGQWVLKEAARQAAAWQAAGICDDNFLRLAINVSSQQFSQQDFVAQVLRIFKQAGVAPKCIELEVTESMLMNDIEDVVQKIEQLRIHGIRISIDDFGTGYSSLSYLKKLPLDQIKIDQSFIRDITNDENDAVVVETIIVMARHLGLNVIAEGVENQQQLDFLIDKGCHAFQGYYFSRPLDAADFTRYMQQQYPNYRSPQAS